MALLRGAETLQYGLKNGITRVMSDHIPTRNPGEIAKLKRAGEVSARILLEVAGFVKPGVTTAQMPSRLKSLIGRNAATLSSAMAVTQVIFASPSMRWLCME